MTQEIYIKDTLKRIQHHNNPRIVKWDFVRFKSSMEQRSNHQTKEMTYTKGEKKIFVNHTSIRRLISRVHKELYTTNPQISQQ